MVEERQSCSPWKGRNLIRFFPPPLSPTTEKLGEEHSKELHPVTHDKDLWLRKSQGRFFSEALLTDSRGMLLDSCWQQPALNPAAKASSSLLIYEWATVPALHPNLCKATLAAVR